MFLFTVVIAEASAAEDSATETGIHLEKVNLQIYILF